MTEIAIRADKLSKRFRVGRMVRYRTLRDSLTDALRSPARIFQRNRRGKDFFWALQDASFEIAPGEVVGLIGRNGAGKTTLLKVLSRITRPTEGYGQIRGRVGSLLEVGTGFHPELTGRENVFLSAAILGMKRQEVAARFDAIVDFSGVERFLDTPLKHYSAGMQTRLAFAVAAHLDPEILLVDEVLAVGDLEFQRKCMGRMDEVARGGRTIFFVSHHMGHIRSLCHRCIWLDRGKIRADGDMQTVVSAYEAAILSGPAQVAESRDLQIYHWELVGAESNSDHRIDRRGPVAFRFDAFLPEPIPRGVLGIHLSDELGRVVWHLDWDFSRLQFGPCSFRIYFPNFPLRPGAYVWRAAISNGGKWSEIWSLMPPLIMATRPIAVTQSNFHSVLDPPFEIEVRSIAGQETEDSAVDPVRPAAGRSQA